MIECKIEEPAQDITSEMAAAAKDILHQYCRQRERCRDCLFVDKQGGCALSGREPERWPDLDSRCDGNNMLELLYIIGNTVIYMRDGVPTMLTCGDRKQAEQIAEEMKNPKRKEGRGIVPGI